MAQSRWITEKGKLTGIFEKALDRTDMKGKVVASMNKDNCAKVGNWMADHTSAWHEPGKNIKTEGRMMIAVLGRPKSATGHKQDIKECAGIVGDKLRNLAPTPRKK